MHLITRKIDDQRIINGRESHGVIAHEKTDFSTRQTDSIKHAWMTLTCYICYARPSVPPSVCHTGVSYKMVEVMIMKFTPYGSPIPLVFAG